VRAVAKSFVTSSPTLVVPVLVLAGMGFGVITPTEVGVACAAYALALGLLYREATFRSVYECFVDSSRSTVTIMFIIAISTVAGWIYTYDGVAQALAEAM